jgi:hypothetical protein
MFHQVQHDWATGSVPSPSLVYQAPSKVRRANDANLFQFLDPEWAVVQLLLKHCCCTFVLKRAVRALASVCDRCRTLFNYTWLKAFFQRPEAPG